MSKILNKTLLYKSLNLLPILLDESFVQICTNHYENFIHGTANFFIYISVTQIFLSKD